MPTWMTQTCFFLAFICIIKAYTFSSLNFPRRSQKVFRYTINFALKDNFVNGNAKVSNERIDPAFYVEDLYGVLGVPATASREELKEAYWSISSRNHPDRNNVISTLLFDFHCKNNRKFEIFISLSRWKLSISFEMHLTLTKFL